MQEQQQHSFPPHLRSPSHAQQEPIKTKSLNFGQILYGEEAKQSFVLYNTRDFPCSLSIRLEADRNFSLDGGSGEATLGPREEALCTVLYAPSAPGEHWATLHYQWSGAGAVAVRLRGTCGGGSGGGGAGAQGTVHLGAALGGAGLSLDLGEVEPPGEALGTVKVSNDGDEPLPVTAYVAAREAVEAASWSLVGSPAAAQLYSLPGVRGLDGFGVVAASAAELAVPPRGERRVAVRFSPVNYRIEDELVEYRGWLALVSRGEARLVALRVTVGFTRLQVPPACAALRLYRPADSAPGVRLGSMPVHNAGCLPLSVFAHTDMPGAVVRPRGLHVPPGSTREIIVEVGAPRNGMRNGSRGEENALILETFRYKYSFPIQIME